LRIEELQAIFEDDGGKVSCKREMSHAHNMAAITGLGTLLTAIDSRISTVEQSPGGVVSWDAVQGKPATFPPEAHVHDYAAVIHTHPYEPADANLQGHLQTQHSPSNAQKNSDITKAEIEAKLIGGVTTHTHDYAATNHLHTGVYEPVNTINSAVQTALNGKQATLVSNTNIKTVNGVSLLGSGDISVGAGASDNFVVTTQTVNNNAVANTLADVTGASFAVTNGLRYWFEITIPYSAAATTTGSRWVINGPTGAYNYTSEYTLTATTKTINCLSAANLPAASNATSLTVGNLVTIWGFVSPSANGTIQVRFASEVANSAITALPGLIRWRTF
jgi:hypothetical protein